MREPPGQRIKVAIEPVAGADFAREPIGIDRALAHDRFVEREHEVGMDIGRNLPVIRQLAQIPQASHAIPRGGEAADSRPAAGDFQRHLILCLAGADQIGSAGGPRKACLQLDERGEIERRIPPPCKGERIKGVILDRLDQLFLEGCAAAGGAEAAILLSAPGAARNLCQFGRKKPAMALAVEFTVGCEGDVANFQIEPHADRIGRNDMIDLPAWNIATCALRVRGESEPITTAAPPR